MYRLIFFVFFLFCTNSSAQELESDDSFSYDEKPQAQEDNVDKNELEACKISAGTSKPRIQVDLAKPVGSPYSTIYIISGKIVGSCIDEAGYYENGEIKQKFYIPLSTKLTKFNYNITTYKGLKAEVRVYSLDGRQDKLDIEEEIRRNR